MSLINQNKWNHVPLLIGTNHDEGTLFLLFIPFVISGFHFLFTAENYDRLLMHFFNNNRMTIDLIKEKYLVHKNYYANNSAVTLRDYYFLCDTRRIARAITQIGHEPV